MEDPDAGSRIELTAGTQVVEGYVSAPAAGAGRGVLVLHDARGFTEHPRRVCDRLAREGFVALAPDLLSGQRASDETEAERFARELDASRAERLVAAGLAALLGHHAVDGPRVGVVGFGLGGALALLAASRSHRVAAVVDLYGFHPHLEIDWSRVSARVLGIFAGADPRAGPDRIEALRACLEAAGVQARLEVRPDVPAAFMDESRPDRYDARAAQDCWDALLAFLGAELG